MSNISETRTELAALVAGAITGEWTGLDYIPARYNGNEVYVSPGNPYLEDGPTFGSYLLRLIVTLTVRTGSNEVMTTELDTAIDDAVVALANAAVSVETVSQPYALGQENGQFLAVDITTLNNITL